jgi:predicted ferric reductase
MVAWALLAATVFWGLIYAGRLTRKAVPPAWNLDLHRFLGGLSVIFVALHIVGLAADQYVNFGWSQIFLPFASHWRPGAVAWGITALYLVIAVEATSLVMRWLPRKLWRGIHLSSFVLFVVATIHAIESGTDTGSPIVRVLGVALIVLAVATAALRVVNGRQRRAARSRAAVRGPAPRPPAAAPTPPAEAALEPVGSSGRDR